MQGLPRGRRPQPIQRRATRTRAGLSHRDRSLRARGGGGGREGCTPPSAGGRWASSRCLAGRGRSLMGGGRVSRRVGRDGGKEGVAQAPGDERPSPRRAAVPSGEGCGPAGKDYGPTQRALRPHPRPAAPTGTASAPTQGGLRLHPSPTPRPWEG